MEKDIVIVTDAKWRKSLAAIRALNKNNYIISIGDSILNMGLWSKYVDCRKVFPNIEKHMQQYEKLLLNLLKNIYLTKNKKTILMPMEECTIETVLSNSEFNRYCTYLLPSMEAFLIAKNKWRTIMQAKKIGIKIPYTKEFHDALSLKSFLKDNCNWEWVVKPEESKGSLGVKYITGVKDLDDIDRLWKRYGKLIVQERIPQEGDSICVGLICDYDHKIVRYFAYKRIRTYPISGGPSTCRISVIKPDLVKDSCALINSLKWRGVAMIEWKRDVRDGIFKLMEINPRFWGGLELAIKCGINFPQLYVDLASNRNIQSKNSMYPKGIISRWVIPGELLWLMSRRKGSTDYSSFFHNIVKDSDELNIDDIPGSVATVICQGIQLFNPDNWKYFYR